MAIGHRACVNHARLKVHETLLGPEGDEYADNRKNLCRAGEPACYRLRSALSVLGI
jgi:hypothetical protein